MIYKYVKIKNEGDVPLGDCSFRRMYAYRWNGNIRSRIEEYQDETTQKEVETKRTLLLPIKRDISQ